MSYCKRCAVLPETDFNKIYHDNHYGFPINDDNELFGRLILEINQAGLSWITILKKEQNFRNAYSQFNIQNIANYAESDRARLLNDAGIIRNRLKVEAVVHNAKKVLEIQSEFHTFQSWLDENHPLSLNEWTKLFKKTFKFVGGEIVNEFLMSTGYLKGAHIENCAIFAKVKETKPKWLTI